MLAVPYTNSKDVLLYRIENEYKCCDTNLVINGVFHILNPHKWYLWFKRDRTVPKLLEIFMIWEKFASLWWIMWIFLPYINIYYKTP